MTRSKKIFIACAVAFFLALAYMAYDIGSRTTFPGSPHQQQSSDSLSVADSLARDSL